MSEPKAKLIKTKNVLKSMQSYASSIDIPFEESDFSIKSAKTYIKTSSFPDFTLFNGNVNEEYIEKEKILNEHLEFQQVYIIEAKKKKHPKLDLIYSIDFELFSTHPKITIHPDSKIPYKNYKARDIFILLVQEFNKIKIQNGILINIFDITMIDTLKKFVKYLYAGKFTKKIKISLFEGLEPELTQESQLIMHFQKKKSDEEFIEVDKEELLIEFLKPLYGKKGFNCFGKIIEAESKTNVHDLDIEIDEASVLIKEDSRRKSYISKVKGYVTLTDKKLLVENKVRVAGISRLHTSISKQEENNLEVYVSQADTNKDSVGAGVELTSETIHITGHIGANSIIEAVNLQIDGATHKDSSQFAKIAKINRHKGTLRCQDANITLLEGGIVHASTVHVESALGGVIYAQDVTIGTVKNNLKVYASHSITLKTVSGEDNIFKINYKEVPILTSKIYFIDKEIQDLKDSLEDAKRHNLSKVPLLEEKISKLVTEKDKVKNSTKSATITIQRALLGLNTIIFTLDNGDELVYKTSAQAYEPFFLETREDQIILHPVNKIIPINL